METFTFTVNWHVVGEFVAFSIITGLVIAIIDISLGIREALKDVPRWRVFVHETTWMILGILVYVLFLK